jgi:tyrosinase
MMFPRRTALRMMSAGVVVAFSGKVTFAQNGPPKRRSLTNMPLDADDISTYRDFVDVMTKKDQTQPLSWLGYSLQHGAADGDFKYCPHGDWYLLPWHREYVHMYEVAARVLTNNPSFAMPYWNWTEMRDYPEAFANPLYKGMPNPLYIPNRNNLTGSFALTDAIVGQSDVIDKINAETVYERFGTSKNPQQTDTDPAWVPAGGGFQGILERTPHNNIHNYIGAFMPTAGSPRDPIFFMHHSNIDRIWAAWNGLGRTNSTDPLWLDMTFTNNYIDPTGALYSATVKDLQDITKLGYTYDVLPRADGITPDPGRVNRLLALLHAQHGAAVTGVERLGTSGVDAKIFGSAIQPLVQRWSLTDTALKSVANPAANQPRTEVYAMIREITLGDRCRGVRVFLNRPNLTIDVPNTDPHFVTTFTFLAHGAGHGPIAGAHNILAGKNRLPSVLVDLTDTIQRLYGFKRLRAGDLTVQLIPVPAPGVALESVGSVKPSSIEIIAI